MIPVDADNITDILSNDYAAFEQKAMEVFHLQYAQNETYRQFCQLVNKKPGSIDKVADIPFLPISLFKTHKVCTGTYHPQCIFESSGTTGIATSRHYVKDIGLYEKSFTTCFHQFYGYANKYCILALLPSYLERANSSLVYMANHLIQLSGNEKSGFYIDDLDALANTLDQNEKSGQKTIIMGVTFAMLDFAEKFARPLRSTILMETGGMKGRKKEILRTQVHSILQKAFDAPYIHSEYGMTELMSQAYAPKDGLFCCPPWMKIFIRAEDDPFAVTANAATGAVNIIDLANVHSCAFIATDDLGKLHPDGSFEILGRLDNSDVRGCSLLSV